MGKVQAPTVMVLVFFARRESTSISFKRWGDNNGNYTVVILVSAPIVNIACFPKLIDCVREGVI